jgi:hypothetical protein
VERCFGLAKSPPLRQPRLDSSTRKRCQPTISSWHSSCLPTHPCPSHAQFTRNSTILQFVPCAYRVCPCRLLLMVGPGRTRFAVAITLVLAASLCGCDTGTITFYDGCDPRSVPGEPLYCSKSSDAGSPEDVLRCDCLTNYSNDWTPPSLLWMGPPEQAPPCPEVTPTLDREGWMDLAGSQAICSPCECGEPTGQCLTMPPEIKVRTAHCGVPEFSTSPFNGPGAWDGSCTEADAIPGGAKCPEGSPTLCARSVEVGVLGAPVNEQCVPLVPPPPELPPATWSTFVRMCSRASDNEDKTDCRRGEEKCAPPLDEAPSGFRQCIRWDGDHACPDKWDGLRLILHDFSAVKDSRTCSECICGAPTGGRCSGLFKAYSDASCQDPAAQLSLSSLAVTPGCVDIDPGTALGSKDISELTYLRGVCSPGGGEPIGEVVPDPDSGLTTVCCARDPEPIP